MWAARLIVVLALLQAVSVVAQTPSPALLVLNKGANELVIVDPATMKIVGRVPVGEGPHEVATDGKLAFVANYGARTPGNTLSIIDLASQKETKRQDLRTLQRPHGIVVSGGKVYFTAEDTTARWSHDSTTRPADLRPPNGVISSFDPSGREGWTWNTGQNGTHMLVMSTDGNLIFASNIPSNSVSVFDRKKPQGSEGTTIPVGKGPEGIDISPDGNEVWVAHSQDGGVSIISVDGKKVVQTFSIATKRSNRLKFTPDGKMVMVSDMDGDEVVVLDSRTRREVKRIKTGGHPEGILMDPSGTRAFVALSGEGVIATVDLKSLEVTNKLATGPGADGMAWVK